MRKWTSFSLALFVACGIVFVAAAVSSDGWDFRPEGGDVTSVLADRTRNIEHRRAEVDTLQSEVEDLSKNSTSPDLTAENARIEANISEAGLTKKSGSGVRVVLTDAPRSVDVPGLDPNLLVVHQQDIQAVVNAMWQGGADAVTLQGQRLISTTGIRCVGNTVLLNGIPYSPPYVIEAIGSDYELNQSLDGSPEVVTYVSYAERYGLGFERSSQSLIKAPAFQGAIALEAARPLS